jgi:hypothetical protein
MKKHVLGSVTHIMDCECYTVNKRMRLREVSIHNVCDKKTFTYHIYHLKDEIPYTKTVHYQIYKIHGLPIVHSKITKDFYTTDEVYFFLKQHFLEKDVLVAYKGGRVEYDILAGLDTKSVNLEVFGCPKYKELILKHNMKQECCCYHLNDSYHCSGHEVKMFARFVSENM